jgi:putative ABC transport system permease protein
LGVVLALLLISCCNAANLLLARAVTRRRQMAMRAALGAGKFRLIQSSLIESLLFALFGGAAGCLLAFFMLRVLVAVSPDAMLRLHQAAIDSRALAFSLLASLLAALLFGSLPAFESPRAESLLGWHSIGGRGFTVRHILVAFQIAMSLVLLTGATLFTQPQQTGEPTARHGARTRGECDVRAGDSSIWGTGGSRCFLPATRIAVAEHAGH